LELVDLASEIQKRLQSGVSALLASGVMR
jgi:hypothetical protein